MCRHPALLLACTLLMVVVTMVEANPTLYKLQGEMAEEIKIPVSSTVIPLDSLPEINVGFGFGFDKKERGKKPAFLKNIKLITSKNRHRFVAPAGVQKLSKADFESFARG